ncbi:MAG: sel1 repeat family protein, partial [Sphingomonadales bacterium]
MRYLLALAALSTASAIPAAQDRNDLASRVKAGEGWGTSAITTGEITACWATWKALREHVAQNGQGSFPPDYTVANLDWRVADWTRALERAFAQRPEDRVPESNQELQLARTEIGGAKIGARAEASGSCKKLPEGIRASAAPKSPSGQAKASVPTKAAPAANAESPALTAASTGPLGAEAFTKGVAHRDGVGRPINRAAAYYWFLRAAMAQDPHPDAARELARSRESGPLESAEGAALFKQAEHLVLYASTDRELKASKPKSFALHLQAAELGHLPSINTMMSAFRERGWGTEPDIVKSREWAQISAEFGDREGERVLAAYM